MAFLFRAASAAASLVCAFAASGGFSGGSASQAQTSPALLQSPTGLQVEALPPVAAPTKTVDDGIVAQPLPEPELPAAEARQPRQPRTLAQLVSAHAQADVDDAELRCLATAVYFESKGEPLGGQLAVAKVIINRANSGRFARTLCGVVKQPSQFSFVRRGVLPTPPNNLQWRQAVAIATIAAQDLHQAPMANAMYFHARRVSPGWNRPRVGAVGNHIFYR